MPVLAAVLFLNFHPEDLEPAILEHILKLLPFCRILERKIHLDDTQSLPS